MKKNLLFLLLVVAMGICVLTGCGSDAGNDDADTNTDVTANAVETRTVYVTPEWLQSTMNGDQEGYEDVLVAEVTYTGALEDVADDSAYATGHIPGAILVGDVDVEDAVGSVDEPYNLLAPEVVEQNLLNRGITKDTKVVLYGDDPSGVARVAYGMIWAGVEDVKIVNGGIAAWTAAGLETETDANEPEAAAEFGVEVPAHPEYWVSMADAKDKLVNDENFKLVSIRSEPEFLGETSGYGYMDKAGEPVGAVWGKGAQTAFDVADFTEDADGVTLVKDLAGFQEVWADCDFTLENDLAFYCGTGWRASVPFLVLYENGYDNIALYDGGWYEWIFHDENPVQVGDPNSDNCEITTVGELPNDKAAK